MTVKDYFVLYTKASGKSDLTNTHKTLVGAERALASIVAPKYYSAMGNPGNGLLKTGEYNAYWNAYDTYELDDTLVKELTPTGDIW